MRLIQRSIALMAFGLCCALLAGCYEVEEYETVSYTPPPVVTTYSNSGGHYGEPMPMPTPPQSGGHYGDAMPSAPMPMVPPPTVTTTPDMSNSGGHYGAAY
jgi:hypothetical protein